MKVLKFLVNSKSNLIIKKLVDYAIDAGHFVYFNATCIDSSDFWLKKYTHGFKVTDPKKMDINDYDYVIDFEDVHSFHENPKIELGFEFAENQFSVFVFLKKEDLSVLVSHDRYHLPSLCESVGTISSERFVEKIAEVVTDSIIYLSRFGHDQLVFDKKLQAQYTIADWIRFERALESLNQFYGNVKASEKVFSIRNLFSLSSDHEGYSEFNFKLQNKLIGFSQNDIEILALYLLALQGSRQNGIYGYDLYSHSKKMSKFVEIDQSASESDLIHQCNHDRYQVLENGFYFNPDLLDCSLRPEVAVSYQSDTPIDGYLVSIRYDRDIHELQVRYAKGLYFFENLEDLVQTFICRLNEFKLGKFKLSHLASPSGEYLNRCLKLWNSTAAEYPEDKTVCQLFEARVEQAPDHIAVIYGEKELTYRQLNEKSNQLARYLLSHSEFKAETLVALYLDRTEDLIISILAVLKAGGAYIPLDLKYPEERVRRILQDSKARVVITQNCYLPIFQNPNHEKQNGSENGFALIKIDQPDVREKILEQETRNLDSQSFSNHLAYVIYTSGTTGNPKGVMIEHRNLNNILTSIAQEIQFTNQDRILAVTTIAFDIAALELFMPLIHGATIILASQNELLDTPKLIELIEEKGATLVQATPSLWSLITQSLKEKQLNIRALCGGEALPISLSKELFKNVKRYWNVYGPTETTVWSTIKEGKEEDAIVSIGSPIANTQCYVLDENLVPLPVGAIGELYIGGAGLARGYLNSRELTEKKFIFRQNERLYKTGDLVRWMPNGNIEFLGRNDFQVKIRGHRIELGEIETILSTYPGITQSVVLVKGNSNGNDASGSQFLAGYYVSEEKLNEEYILNFLQGRLPEYMVPNVLVHLKSLPLNVNGKFDRKELPNPEFKSKNTHIPPRNDLEKQLCDIWADVLGLKDEKLSIQDDFFNLGGNSILAIRLVNKINSEFQSDVKISDIFNEKTVGKISALVQESTGKFLYRDHLISNIDHENLFSPFPLTNVQQTYYLGRFSSFELSNVSTHVYCEYKYSQLDVPKLEKAMNRLIHRHLALRTIFVNDQQQFVKDFPYYKIEFLKLSTEQELLNIRNRLSHKVYTPDVYPLFDIVVSQFDSTFVIHMSFDAIIVDMSSFEILFKELTELYLNPDSVFPELQVSYRDYALQYERVRTTDLFKKAEVYWENKLDHYNFEMKLPLVARPSEIKYPKFTRLTKTISKEIWSKVVEKAQQRSISPTALVLEVYGKTLSFWSGQDRLCVNLTLFNRLPFHSQVNDVIGDFTVLELFDYFSDETKSIDQKLRDTHQNLLKDIENNLFDGIDFQRLVKSKKSIPNSQIIAPAVLTSVLGNSDQSNLFELRLDHSYQGVQYSISQTSQVWLDNKAYETSEGFVAEWDYVDQLFDRQVIEAMHETYCDLIVGLAQADWDKSIFPKAKIPAQDLKLIEGANSFEQEVSEGTLFGRFEEIALRAEYQDRIAVIDSGLKQEFTYAQLFKDTEHLSQVILSLNTKGQLVGILSEKGYSQVVSTLSIMKAGKSYLPLNVDWPVGRLDEVLEQGQASLLLISRTQYSEAHIREALSQKYQLLVIEDVLSEAQEKGAEARYPYPKVESDDVAYVIFTSGSTGKPKGVTISHRGALNTIDAINRRFQVIEKDRVLALSELSFDLSVYDLFGILAVGGCIVFPDQRETKNPRHWIELIQKNQITIWNTVPQLAGLLVDEANDLRASLDPLRVYLMSGDWIPTSLPDKLKFQCPSSVVMSLGGATEGSIWSIWYEIKAVQSEWSSIPYGVAMPNQKMYVLNQDQEHCPVGVAGDIYIGGSGVALNYWGDEELTRSKFISHSKLGRLYKTGDLGKWRRDGNIEFLGRSDFQVKLNGYRVELEEISSKLSKLSGVEDAIVRIQKDEGRDFVVGYLLPENSKKNKTPRKGSDEKFDKESFKLEQNGILKNAELIFRFESQTDEKLITRKSYRHFKLGEGNPSEVISAGKFWSNSEFRSHSSPNSNELSKRAIEAVLMSLSGVTVENRILPKYRYPSAGSSYSVRCFLGVSDSLKGIHPGYYYYHPTENGLFRSNESWIRDESKSYNTNEIHLVVNWPSILPLYGDRSKRLALQEAGHVLSLLLEKLNEERINYEVHISEEDLNDENTRVVKIILGTRSIYFPTANLKINYLVRDAKNQAYIDEKGEKRFDLSQENIFFRADEVGRILSTGKVLAVVEGEGSTLNTVVSGFLLQKVSDQAHQSNWGSCMLGFLPYPGALYSMVMGKVSDEEKSKSETQAPAYSLLDIVNQELAQDLPEYMFPGAYIVLDEIPLTANGKLASDRLPVLQMKDSYLAPERDSEIKISKIWSEILGLPQTKVGVKDSFFRLGGNSLFAMQVVRRLNHDLGISLKLIDLYKFNTIQEISQNFCEAIEVESREEGVIL